MQGLPEAILRHFQVSLRVRTSCGTIKHMVVSRIGRPKYRPPKTLEPLGLEGWGERASPSKYACSQ